MSKKIFILFPVLFLFIFSLFVGIDRFVHRKSLKFSLSKIAALHEPFDCWDIPSLKAEENPELDKLFSRSFTFFGKSNHAYLFLSEDHKYVLKFLKRNAFYKSWLSYIPASFNRYYQEYRQKQEEQRKIFTACKTAFMEFKEETGLIYMHINPTHTLNKKISIFDKNGKSYVVELDKACFYVQKRAQLIYPRIAELMRRGNIDRAKQIISSVFSLIDYLGKKGVCDHDLSLYKNFGIIDDKAVQLAISKLQIDHSYALSTAYKQDIPIITEPFRRWIIKNYPELLAHFDEKLDEISTRDTSQISLPS